MLYKKCRLDELMQYIEAINLTTGINYIILKLILTTVKYCVLFNKKNLLLKLDYIRTC